MQNGQIEEIKSQHEISKTKTLIDLNKSSINFEAEIIVECHSDEPMYVAILNQTQLDNSPEINYTRVFKQYKDYIKVTDNVYQNYFCVLKSDNPVSVSLCIKLHELPKVFQQPQIQPQDEKSFSIWKIIFYTSLVGIIGFLIYKYFFQNKSFDTDSKYKTYNNEGSKNKSNYKLNFNFNNSNDDYDIPNFKNLNKDTFKRYSFMY